MHRVIDVTALPGFVLELVFEDGVVGQVNLASRLFGPMFEPLKDPEFFSQVFVDPFGAVCWPNNADLSPEALYSQITGQAAQAITH